jgi:hypothetical protein
MSWNKYAYALNNSLKFKDPDGRTTVVFTIEGADVRVNRDGALGHTALLIDHRGKRSTVDLGGGVRFSTGVAEFVNGYLQQGRRVRAFLLKQDSAAEAKMQEFLGKDALAGTARASLLRGNCTSGVCNTLRAGGLIDEGSNPETTIFVDLPKNLESALQDNGQLGSIVQTEFLFSPLVLGSVTPEQIEDLLGIQDEILNPPPE